MNQTANVPAASPRRGHVLLVSPLTFNYHQIICDTLRSLGYEVTWWNERASDGTLHKILLRLLPGWTRKVSQRHFLRRLDALDPRSVSHVLVIKGEGLTTHVVQQMRQRFPGASMGFYLWDGLENVPGAPALLGSFDSVATFDPQDAQRHGWNHRPLFAKNTAPIATPASGYRFDWCFIGTLHSDRYRVVNRVRQSMKDAARAFVFGFFPSTLQSVVARLRSPVMWRAARGELSTRAMAPAQVRSVVAQSCAVLDVEHPRQRGLTMRTIETLLAGKKLITTNRHILESDLFHPSRVLLISRSAPAIDDAFLGVPFEPVEDSLRQSYSCEGWALQLLAAQEQARARRPDT